MKVLLTGGSGTLGTELVPILEAEGALVTAPPSAEVDITDPAAPLRAVQHTAPDVVVHAAAYTDVDGAETERARAWRVNVDGTRHVALACRDAGVPLVHISTDYVFGGEAPPGGYAETDPLGPPMNHYALTKIAAEALARCAPAALVLRTSFRGRTWPYPTAFTDVTTGQDYVDVIAPRIAAAILHRETVRDRFPDGTLHVATPPKTAFGLARRRRPDVRPGTRAEAHVTLPGDVSLDLSRWTALNLSVPSR